MHRRYRGNRGRLKQGDKFKCLIKASQKAFIEDCPGVEFNEQSVEVVERFSFVNLVTQ